MEFMNPHYLWLLLALPVYFAVWFYWGRRSHTLKNTQVCATVSAPKPVLHCPGSSGSARAPSGFPLVLGLAGTVFLPLNKVGTDSAGVIYMTIDTSGSTKTGGVHFPYENWLGYYFDKRTNPEYKPPTANPEDAARAIQPVDTELGAAKMFIEHAGGLRIGLTVFDSKFFLHLSGDQDPEVAISVLDQIRTYTEQVRWRYQLRRSGGQQCRRWCAWWCSCASSARKTATPRAFTSWSPTACPALTKVAPRNSPPHSKELGIHFFVFGVDSPGLT